MSTETNQYDMSQFSDETRQLLASGLSAVAAQQAMGLGTGEEAEQRRREQEELAADMERKNREIQLKRAAAVTGGPVVAPSEVPEQKPKLKGRRKKQMPSQEPTVVPDARIKPATPIPESPVQDSQLPPGLTQEDIALIERVKASRNAAIENFLSSHDTVHPHAFDARQQQSAPEPPPVQNQDRDLMVARQMATFNGQGNPAYGQQAPVQYGAPAQMFQAQRMQPQFNIPQPPDPREFMNIPADAMRLTEAPAPERHVPDPIATGIPAYGQTPAPTPAPERHIPDPIATGIPAYGQTPAPTPAPERHIPDPIATGIPAYGQAPAPTPAPPQPAPYIPQPPVQQTAAPAYSEVDPDAAAKEPEAPKATFAERPPLSEPTVDNRIHPAQFDPGTPDPDYQQFNEITGWPSQGRFYRDSIYGQGLTTIDADMLSAMDIDDPMEVYNTFTAILGRRVKGISPDDILSGDEEYLIYWLRASTYLGESLPRPAFTCPACGTEHRTADMLLATGTLGFRDQVFTVDQDPAEIAAMHASEGYVRYTMYDGRESAIYLRRRKHDKAIAEYMDRWEHANNRPYPEYRSLNTSLASFMEIEDCETMSEKIKYLEDYPLAKRSEMLKSVFGAQITSHTSVRMKCSRCGGTVTVPYKFRASRFLASLR